MLLRPVKNIRIAAAGTAFADPLGFGFWAFEPASWTESPLTYSQESGHKIAYAYRTKFTVDIIDFSAADYARLLAFDGVDVEVTFGVPGERTIVETLRCVRLDLSYNMTEGVERVKLAVEQTRTASGIIMPVTKVTLATGDDAGAQRDYDIIECRVGIEYLRLPYQTSQYEDVDRIHGFKRKAKITISPIDLAAENQGFGDFIETWLSQELKWVRAANFFGVSASAFRRVTCTNVEELMEERIDSIRAGRNLVLEVRDAERSVV